MRKSAQQIDRRRFLKAVPATVAVGVVLPSLTPSDALAQRGGGTTPPKIGKDALKGAEQIAGLHFSDAEEEAALSGVSRNLDAYEELRKLDVPMDTEPAITFRPHSSSRAGRPLDQECEAVDRQGRASGRRQPRGSRVRAGDRPRVAHREPQDLLDRSHEDVLARLKRYGEPLHCVITSPTISRSRRRRMPTGDRPATIAGRCTASRGARKISCRRKAFEPRGCEADTNTRCPISTRPSSSGCTTRAPCLAAVDARWRRAAVHGGSTRNPWSPENSSSGSSAGPGSATAAGLVGFSIGTETRGSIISPSSTCGVVGLRPTYGRVSRYGAMALSWTMDKIGPMCRSVEDCALVFNAIYGTDGKDDTVVDAPFEWNPDVPLSKLRIGYLASEFDQLPNAGGGRGDGGRGGGGGRGGAPVDPAVLRRRAEERNTLLKDALDVLRAQGAKLEPMTLPDFPANAINFILDAEAAAAFDDLTRSGDANQMTNSSWPNSFRTSRFIPAVEYIRAQRARTLLVRQMDAAMAKFDVFLSPTGGNSLGITNLTGHPAACLKAGFVDGLPQALMITGRLYDEAAVLRVALAYERATKWHTMNPALEELAIG
jgi:Asp-tRNA(Asn)/Glu-tRNA(Gln) amidotransferase A subunit family amidase